MSTSFVQAEKLRPTAFEVEYFDQYDFYSLTDRYSGGSSRKGRSKKEAEDHTNRPNPAEAKGDNLQKMKKCSSESGSLLRFWTPWQCQ
ncbi:nuclear protein 1-like [Crotalus adamanteus]|uniref:Nuclear protein 1-like n=1 Tax=Crotalus adamanteus TaxID=8729 RepID=A0AAW1B659_CROAD